MAKMTSEQIDAQMPIIRRMAAEGATWTAIARATGVSANTCQRRLQAEADGREIVRPGPPMDEQRLRQLWDAGMPQKHIAQVMGCGESKVNYWTLKLGMRGPPGSAPS